MPITEPSQARLCALILNGTVFLAIVGFSLAVGARLLDFVQLLIAWNAMAAWVRISHGEFPKFDDTPFPRLFLIAFAIWVWTSSWIAIDPLVKGQMPLVGVVYLYAFTGLPELTRQYLRQDSKTCSSGPRPEIDREP